MLKELFLYYGFAGAKSNLLLISACEILRLGDGVENLGIEEENT
jgi:hypothetical protein